jgi:hypothetical protein
MMKSFQATRFLCIIGAIYGIAFASYWVQFPGLVSSNGLEPAGRIFQSSFPFLYKKIEVIVGNDNQSFWITVDIICEGVTFMGCVLSLLVATGVIHHGLLFLCITYLYYILVQLGGTFYSFQWDTLLLETGFVVGCCYAPWTSRKSEGDTSVGSWPVRFLLFKLMFMSGVVKIQADCPTWKQLTALEYHFATQCLPGPLAWYAHQLHPFFLRLSVAMTLLIEIHGSFLLIFFAHSIRYIGAWMQIILQLMIIATGNYNFFNLLTIALCLPSMDDNVQTDEEKKNRDDDRVRLGQSLLLILFALSFLNMFNISTSDDGFHSITMTWTIDTCVKLINIGVPIAIILSLLGMIYCAHKAFVHQALKYKRIPILFHLLLCISCLGLGSVPLLNLSPRLWSSPWMYFTRQFVLPWKELQKYHVSNGYGLFRRMTGVASNNHFRKDDFGWAGLEPSIVDRPELILESQMKETGEIRELNFWWKPGDVTVMPKQIAPYQPRLDWQIWFAALGRYENNPWLVHMVYKILQGCEPVLNLLDEPLLKNHQEFVSSLSIKLYSYDFTRINTNWNQRIPGVHIVPSHKSTFSSRQWWTRSYKGQYLPSLDANNHYLKEYLHSYGFMDICILPNERCNLLTGIRPLNQLCHWFNFLRYGTNK